MARCAISARPFEGDSELALITARDEADALELARHDFAHVLAEAVQNLFPGTQITFGPATDDGFYYDFAPTAERGPFTEEDLPAIEEEMRRIIAADEPLVREVWSARAGPRLLREAGRDVQGRMGDGAARGRDDLRCTAPAAGSTCAAGRISPRPASSIPTRSS